MSDLVLRTCNICLSGGVPIDQVVFFQCGHHACRACSGHRSYRENPYCAECRRPKGVPHRIFLSSDDLVVGRVGSQGVRQFQEINVNASSESAADRIIKALADAKHLETLQALLGVANDMKQRLSPLSALYDKSVNENQQMLAYLQHLESKVKVEAKSREDEEIRLRKRAEDIIKQRDSKFSDLQEYLRHLESKHKVETSRANAIAKSREDDEIRLRKRAEDYRNIIKQRDSKISGLQEELNESSKKMALMRKKLIILAKSQRYKSRKESSNEDASLIVEGQGMTLRSKRALPNVLDSSPAKKKRRV